MASLKDAIRCIATLPVEASLVTGPKRKDPSASSEGASEGDRKERREKRSIVDRSLLGAVLSSRRPTASSTNQSSFLLGSPLPKHTTASSLVQGPGRSSISIPPSQRPKGVPLGRHASRATSLIPVSHLETPPSRQRSLAASRTTWAADLSPAPHPSVDTLGGAGGSRTAASAGTKHRPSTRRQVDAGAGLEAVGRAMPLSGS
ncbi:hypothetical protein M432DRAFT_637706 [Thermoascus aurantiacus ATCC 26904]